MAFGLQRFAVATDDGRDSCATAAGASAARRPTAPVKSESHGRRIAIGLGILLAVVAVYVLSLVGVHLLAKSGPRSPQWT